VVENIDNTNSDGWEEGCAEGKRQVCVGSALSEMESLEICRDRVTNTWETCEEVSEFLFASRLL